MSTQRKNANPSTRRSNQVARFASLLRGLPVGRRGGYLQQAVSFGQAASWAEADTVGELRAAFADCWEDVIGCPVPIRKLRTLLEPPLRIGLVLEFGRFQVVEASELAMALTDFVEKLHETCCLESEQVSDSKSPVGSTVDSLETLVGHGQRFSTIYADPPWAYNNRASRAAAANHYPTMSLDSIRALPVSDLVEDQAHLHLWTTNAFLPSAFDVIESWGFEFKSCLIWVKDQIGLGNYWRVSHEFLLLGVRGKLRFSDRSQRSWIQAPRTVHSRKPDFVREIIEKVSPGPYLELFGRTELPNSQWTVFGNQIERRLF